MKTSIVGPEVVQEFVRRSGSFTLVTLCAGARLSCCDEAVVMEDDAGAIIGLATISAEGEEQSGVPSIVAVYVVPAFRNGSLGSKVGTAVFRAALERCIERGFSLIHVDVLSDGMQRIIDALPPNLGSKVQADRTLFGLYRFND